MFVHPEPFPVQLVLLDTDSFVSIFVSTFVSTFGRVTNLQPNQRHRVSGGSLL